MKKKNAIRKEVIMFVVINGNKNYLPFCTPTAPGYGQPAQCTSIYSDQATAAARLGSGNLMQLYFMSNPNTIFVVPGGGYAGAPQWPWSFNNLFVVYYGRSGTLMGLFRNQLDAQKYATALGAGYTTAACSLSVN
jgi:hypothetical protein